MNGLQMVSLTVNSMEKYNRDVSGIYIYKRMSCCRYDKNKNIKRLSRPIPTPMYKY